MFKKLIILSVAGLSAFAVTGRVYAAKNVSVRIQQPKSPINQNNFTVSFVVLDLQGRTVTVKCFQKGPSDAAFSQFGSTQTFADGGNSGSCAVDNAVLNDGEGTYSFKVEATAGDGSGDNFDAETTTVTYDTSGPGDLRDYSKNKTNSCEYTIHFKTANDGGATVKAELYRSDAVPFNADGGSRIQVISIGSDEAKNVTDTPPDCGKTYYYAVRAFDAAGNGSALIGDNVSTVTVINPTGSPAQGAIPVSGGGGIAGGSILGQSSTSGSIQPTGTGGETLGDTTPSAEVVKTSESTDKSSTARNMAIAGAILVLGALLYAFRKKKKDPTV